MFVKSESGAVTIDWVVLTAGLVGLGLATMAVVSQGAQDTSAQIKGQMTDQVVYSAFASTTSEGFDTDAGDWIGASVTERGAFGNILGPIGGPASDGSEQMFTTFDLSDHDGPVDLTFDLLALNSLNNDEAIVYLDGQEVARVNIKHTGAAGTTNGVVEWTFADIEGVTVTPQTVSQNSDIDGHYDMVTGAPRYWNDTVLSVSVQVEDPSESLSLGIGADMNEHIDNEAVAIDNVSLTRSGVNGLGT